jgi:uncharacterized protein (DUF927 family)
MRKLQADIEASCKRSAERRAEVEAFDTAAAAYEPPRGNGPSVLASSNPDSRAEGTEQAANAAEPEQAANAAEPDGAVAGEENERPSETQAEAITRLAALCESKYDQVRKREAKALGFTTVRALDNLVKSAQLEAAKEPTIARLADMTPGHYKRQRREEAKRLGASVTILDEWRKEARQRARKDEESKGFSIQGKPQRRAARKPDKDGVIYPPDFVMKDSGLWLEPASGDDDGEDNAPAPLWICEPFKIIAGTNDDENQNFGLLLHWTDCNGAPHDWAMPLRMVHADGNAIAGELQNAGLSCGTSRKAHEGLKRFFGAVRSIHRMKCVTKAGWHGNAFVLPNKKVFGATDLVMQSEYATKGQAFSARGTLEEWQEHVARPAVGNHRYMLMISAAFAGALLDITNHPSGGVHLHGNSQTGKTTVGSANASVWGSGEPTEGQIRSWRATANGLEAVVAEYNDGCLPLDEIGQADARQAGEVTYMLANGVGKWRMSRTGAARKPLTWRTIFVSTGEVSLAAKMGEGGLRAHAGQEVRLLNVPADAGAGRGVFQDLHGAADAGKFADQIRAASRTYYGTAGPAFLEKLVRERADDPEKLAGLLSRGCEAFLAKHLPGNADGQVRSAAMRFARIGMAGELACEYEVLPWKEGAALEAVGACFQAWLVARGTTGSAEDKRALEAVQAFLTKHGASRFELWGIDPDAAPEDKQRITERAGYVRPAEVGKDSRGVPIMEQEFLILPAAWKEEVCKGLDPKRVAEAAANAGFLIPGKDRGSQSVYVPGRGQGRFYIVRSAILGWEPR